MAAAVGAEHGAVMPCAQVGSARKTYPTGNKNFAVMQPFPATIAAEDADPFLMCDEFGPTDSPGKITNPDEFPVGWHPVSS